MTETIVLIPRLVPPLIKTDIFACYGPSLPVSAGSGTSSAKRDAEPVAHTIHRYGAELGAPRAEHGQQFTLHLPPAVSQLPLSRLRQGAGRPAGT